MNSTRTPNLILGIIVAVGLTLGASAVSYAAVANSSITGWRVSKASYYRAATQNTNQQWNFANECKVTLWAPSTKVEYGQMQFQRSNGIFAPVALGNKNVGCGSGKAAGNWGKVSAGLKHRYQYNGTKVSGRSGLQDPGLSNSRVVITY